MGCVQSREDALTAGPNEFNVVNIDELGNGLWSGRLEVTEQELILHRRGKEPTYWPLRSLRRYGYDGEIFSFESGRRCTTGEGIYAFKCRQAERLFGTLQQCIHVRNHNDERAAEASPYPPGTLPRPSRDRSEYLEPARPAFGDSRFAALRLGSVDSGPTSPSEAHSPGSPSSADILEVMPLAPLPDAGAHVTNLYQFQDFPPHREHNNNKRQKPDPAGHSYLNTGDVNTDLACLRYSLHSQKFARAEDEDAGEFDGPSGPDAPTSPTLSTSSEHYATLAVRNANGRAYMNLNAGDAGVLPAIREEAGSAFAFDGVPLPAGPGPVDPAGAEADEEIHNYANLGIGEINYDPRLLNRQPGNPRRAAPEEGRPPDPRAEAAAKINYAVLDLDKAGDEISNEAPPPSSPKRPAMGYTVIDFNKTEALTSVALGTEVDTEGSRKTRHNSTALPPSPTVT